MRSEAAKTASMSGAARAARRIAAAPLLLVEVAVGLELGVDGQAGLEQRLAIAGEAVEPAAMSAGR